MHLRMLGVVLFAAVVGAGLVGTAAFASEQTDGPAISGLIADDKEKDDKAKVDKEKKVDDGKPKEKPADDKKDRADNDRADKDKADKDKADNDRADKDRITKANGNAGAISVKSGPTTGPGNQPRVGCEFYVSGTNFASTSGTVEFYAWKSTNSFQLVKPLAGPSTYTGTDSSFLNGPYSLPTDGQSAHAQQGYHYKVEATNADGKKVHSRVFWVNCQPTSTGAASEPPAPGATAPVTVVLTMPITVDGPTGSIDLAAGTTVTVPAGTVLTFLPGAPAPAPQLVEVETGTVLGTAAHGSVTSTEEAVGEVVLGEQASILPTGLPRTGGAPLGAAAALGAIIALAGVVARRRSAP